MVRSVGTVHALVRMQSDPILRGLRSMGGVEVTVHTAEPESTLVLRGASCVVFHYSDTRAIEVIRGIETHGHLVLTVCLGGDIFSYADYLNLHEIADLFLVPTDLHRQILQYQLYRPVYTMPECIDPIASNDTEARGGVVEFPIRRGRRMVWFGYADSFYKGMSSILPVIQNSLAERTIDGFEVIVDENRFNKDFGNPFGLATIPYDNTTFRMIAQRFDYALLSHFPLDLTINSYIKSPNKAVTALLSGMIPLASDTPSYRALFTRFGLEKFLFSSPEHLDALLNRLDPVADSLAVQSSGIVPALRLEGSETRLFETFVDILNRHMAQAPGARRNALVGRRPIAMPVHTVGFRAHLSDLLPSFIRAVRYRTR